MSKTKKTPIQKLALKFYETRSDKDFSALYTALHPRLLNYVNKITKNENDSKDVLSTVFSKIKNKIEQYDKDKAQFSTWSYRIARNESLLFKKKQKHISLDFYKDNGWESSINKKIDTEMFYTMNENLDDIDENTLLLKMIKDASHVLDDKKRFIWDSLTWDGLSYVEIKNLLNYQDYLEAGGIIEKNDFLEVFEVVENMIEENIKGKTSEKRSSIIAKLPETTEVVFFKKFNKNSLNSIKIQYIRSKEKVIREINYKMYIASLDNPKQAVSRKEFNSIFNSIERAFDDTRKNHTKCIVHLWNVSDTFDRETLVDVLKDDLDNLIMKPLESIMEYVEPKRAKVVNRILMKALESGKLNRFGTSKQLKLSEVIGLLPNTPNKKFYEKYNKAQNYINSRLDREKSNGYTRKSDYVKYDSEYII